MNSQEFFYLKDQAERMPLYEKDGDYLGDYKVTEIEYKPEPYSEQLIEEVLYPDDYFYKHCFGICNLDNNIYLVMEDAIFLLDNANWIKVCELPITLTYTSAYSLSVVYSNEYIFIYDNTSIYRFDGEDLTLITDGMISRSDFCRIAYYEKDNALLVVNLSNKNIYKIDIFTGLIEIIGSIPTSYPIYISDIIIINDTLYFTNGVTSTSYPVLREYEIDLSSDDFPTTYHPWMVRTTTTDLAATTVDNTNLIVDTMVPCGAIPFHISYASGTSRQTSNTYRKEGVGIYPHTYFDRQITNDTASTIDTNLIRPNFFLQGSYAVNRTIRVCKRDNDILIAPCPYENQTNLSILTILIIKKILTPYVYESSLNNTYNTAHFITNLTNSDRTSRPHATTFFTINGDLHMAGVPNLNTNNIYTTRLIAKKNRGVIKAVRTGYDYVFPAAASLNGISGIVRVGDYIALTQDHWNERPSNVTGEVICNFLKTNDKNKYYTKHYNSYQDDSPLIIQKTFYIADKKIYEDASTSGYVNDTYTAVDSIEASCFTYCEYDNCIYFVARVGSKETPSSYAPSANNIRRVLCCITMEVFESSNRIDVGAHMLSLRQYAFADPTNASIIIKPITRKWAIGIGRPNIGSSTLNSDYYGIFNYTRNLADEGCTIIRNYKSSLTNVRYSGAVGSSINAANTESNYGHKVVFYKGAILGLFFMLNSDNYDIDGASPSQPLVLLHMGRTDTISSIRQADFSTHIFKIEYNDLLTELLSGNPVSYTGTPNIRIMDTIIYDDKLFASFYITYTNGNKSYYRTVCAYFDLPDMSLEAQDKIEAKQLTYQLERR